VVPVHESMLGNALYRLHHYTQFVSYLIWLRRATPHLRKLAATGRYRVAWHVSYSPGWLPSPLRHLDLPTVWGPCTGADRVPGPLRGALSRRSRVRDVLDNISTWMFARIPSTRRSRKSVDLMLLALDNPSVRRARPGQPTEVFIQTSLVDVPEVEEPTEREDCLYFVSPLRAQKGPLLAIEAAARTPGVRLVVAPPQKGQMRAECERIVRDYGAESRVTFVDGLSRPEMLRRLRASKGFVHSALSDVASMALAEALVLGVPVVALDVLGSKTMKSYMTRPEFMPLVAVHDPEQVITDFGQRMLEMLANEDDFPTAPLLDQPALQQQFVDYIDTACQIHDARHAGKGKSTARHRPSTSCLPEAASCNCSTACRIVAVKRLPTDWRKAFALVAIRRTTSACSAPHRSRRAPPTSRSSARPDRRCSATCGRSFLSFGCCAASDPPPSSCTAISLRSSARRPPCWPAYASASWSTISPSASSTNGCGPSTR
jgi:glycosyltransferase involved in cell wall biosynthesis